MLGAPLSLTKDERLLSDSIPVFSHAPLYTRFVAIQLIGLLTVATFYIHLKNGFLWIKGGYEYPLFWLVIMIAIFFKGGGRASIDSSLPKEF